MIDHLPRHSTGLFDLRLHTLCCFYWLQFLRRLYFQMEPILNVISKLLSDLGSIPELYWN